MELVNRPQTKEEREAVKQSFNEFWRQLQEESVYILMPERIKGARRFVALAKELSEAYGIDMDIWEKSYFIQVDLHLYCASYPTELTQRVAELFCLCDRVPFIHPAPGARRFYPFSGLLHPPILPVRAADEWMTPLH